MRLPPYGKRLVENLKDTPIITVPIWIYVGNKSILMGKIGIKAYQPVLSLPPQDHYSEYVWPVQNNNVIITDTGNYSQDQLYEFGAALITVGANLVTIQSDVDDFCNFLSLSY